MTEPTRPLRDRYRNERILLTGASGFLGQALLEKMLRCLPEVAEITLFLRARGRADATARAQELFRSPVFDRLRLERPDFDEWWPRKVMVAQGALGAPRLGLTQEAWSDLARRLTAIIHVGGLAAFDEPLDRVLQVNFSGGLAVLDLAKDAGDIPLTHVSTAYVCGKLSGTHVEEHLPRGYTPRTPTGGADPAATVTDLLTRSLHIRDKAEEGHYDLAVAPSLPGPYKRGERLDRLRRAYADKRLARLGRRAANKLGWPDPYPMSKAFTEQLLMERRDRVPLNIVRPAILASSMNEPTPGWLTGLRMADPIIASMGRGVLDLFPGDPQAVLDIVPCDLAVNAVLAAIPDRDGQEPRVYQVATSASNPLELGVLIDECHRALARTPFVDRRGLEIQPTKVRLDGSAQIRVELERRRRWVSVQLAVFARLGWQRRVRILRARLRFLRHAYILARAYAPYTTRHFRFETVALSGLEQSLTAEDRQTFPLDPKRVAWPDYLTRVHVPAVRREAGGEPPGAD